MLYKVILPNAYFPIGVFVEGYDDGMVQQVRVSTKDGRLEVGGFEGLVIPLEKVRPYVFAILKKGFDDVGAHAEYRGAYRPRDLRSESRRVEDDIWAELSESDPEPDGVEAGSKVRH